MSKKPTVLMLSLIHILMGIFNGTTNFILTKMSQEGMEFGDALRLAQDLSLIHILMAAESEAPYGK